MLSESKHFYQGEDAFTMWGESNLQFMAIFAHVLKDVSIKPNGKKLVEGFIPKFMSAQTEMMTLMLGMSERIRDLEKKIEIMDKFDTVTL